MYTKDKEHNRRISIVGIIFTKCSACSSYTVYVLKTIAICNIKYVWLQCNFKHYGRKVSYFLLPQNTCRLQILCGLHWVLLRVLLGRTHTLLCTIPLSLQSSRPGRSRSCRKPRIRKTQSSRRSILRGSLCTRSLHIVIIAINLTLRCALFCIISIPLVTLHFRKLSQEFCSLREVLVINDFFVWWRDYALFQV